MKLERRSYMVILDDDVATLETVANKLDEMSKTLAQEGVMGYALSLKAQAMTIKSITGALL